ncbi:MAG TPA: hypothetical protein VFK92_13150, partial [Burkholderiales bacterium]|nr:hypothetical protein [Burkholderiales bacterium]
MPNIAVKRDAPNAARPLPLRYKPAERRQMCRAPILLVLLLSVTVNAAAGDECSAVSHDEMLVLDRAWTAIARAKFEDAQNSLIELGNGLSDRMERRMGMKVDAEFSGETQSFVQKELPTVQDVLMWQQITILKAKVELAALRAPTQAASVKRDFENFRQIYCLYY